MNWRRRLRFHLVNRKKPELRQNTVLSQLHQWRNLPVLWSHLCLWGDNWRYTCGFFSLLIFQDFLRTVHKFKKYAWQNLTLTWKEKYSTWVTEYLVIWSVQFTTEKELTISLPHFHTVGLCIRTCLPEAHWRSVHFSHQRWKCKQGGREL